MILQNPRYGSAGAGEIIPPNADLTFEITLVSLKSPKVKIDIIDPKDCSSDKKTRDNDIILFNYVGYFENGKFISKSIKNKVFMLSSRLIP